MKTPLHLRTLHGGPGWWQTVLPAEPPSWRWEPLRRYDDEDIPGLGRMEYWENSRYYCSVRRYATGFFLKHSAYVLIGISNIDESAAHDWRDFQAIKNQLVGRDWEAVELYPAESRLIDPSNRFYLWCVPRGVLKFGLPGGRHVLDAADAIAPQRPFPKEER